MMPATGTATPIPAIPRTSMEPRWRGGIGAALNNAVGGAGVAPETTLVGYRISFGTASDDLRVLDALQHLAGLDVANNSWGFDGYLGDNFWYDASYPVLNQIATALHTAVDSGRGGLGTVVVFAAGNGRASGQDTNYHNFQNDRTIITVAATASTGDIASFSAPGASILVAAPGVSVPTTDRVGAAGYSTGDYATMSGTSFSAPMVSGVAALMLDANPNLGWRDVQEILASTAAKAGSAASWSFNHAGNWNGGAMHVSNDFGFGLVDTLAAVRVAESWRSISTSANEYYTSNVTYPYAAIPDVGSLSSTLYLPAGLRIDRVEIDVALAHADIGQLRLTLTSPDGTQSLLFHNPSTTQANIDFTFSTTHDRGELSGGAWTLTVTDTQTGAAGVLQAWQIRVYGDPVGNDTYVYTDEFSTLAAADPSRLQLSDSGGTDNINTASLASDTVLDLRPGHTSVIDGQNVSIGASTVIENADTGDGNDTLIGNDADNSLRGWRGNDWLDGGAGADTFYGGAGDDTYVVDAAGDAIVEYSNEGTDNVRTALAAFTLAANVENLVYTGTAAFAGGNGSDTLNGGAGADILIGGLGNDTYTVDDAADVVTEAAGAGTDLVNASVTYTLPGEVEKLTLIGGGAIDGTGNVLANVLTGNAADNRLFGLDGNDSLNGGAGADYMAGGIGNDTYTVDNAGDVIFENPNEGTRTWSTPPSPTLSPSPRRWKN
jgi:subtilisin-like proprotein convertase family protein